MALPVPRSLSPSKVSSFKDCALAFRFSVIDRLPEPASPHMVKGTLVHSALEGLFWDHQRGELTPEAARTSLAKAWAALQDDPEFTELALSEPEREAFLAEAEVLVSNYFRLEDPNSIDTVGVELLLEA